MWARRNISEFGSLAPRRTSSSAKSTSYQRHLNRGGIVHGGALLAFADDLGGTVARLNVPDGFRTTTIARRREFLSPRAREEPILPDVQNGARITIQRPETDAICSRRGGRLVQWTAGRRRSRRDSRLIEQTSPRFTVNWPALASSILEDPGPVFTKSEVRSDLASAERAGSAGKHCSSRARGDKNSRSPYRTRILCPANLASDHGRGGKAVARTRAARRGAVVGCCFA